MLDFSLLNIDNNFSYYYNNNLFTGIVRSKNHFGLFYYFNNGKYIRANFINKKYISLKDFKKYVKLMIFK